MCIAGDREQTKCGEHISRKRFKVWIQFEETLSKEWIKILTATFVMNGKNPGEVIQSCGANIDQRNDLLAHAILCRILIHGGMHSGELFGNFDAEVLCQRYTDHAIACINLVTQA